MADEDDFVVLPDHFVRDGTVLQSFNGLPRIVGPTGQATGTGNFQAPGVGGAQPVVGAFQAFHAFGGTNPRPVQADGFSIIGRTPDTINPGAGFPPSWWPPQPPPPTHFATGVPSVFPPWSPGPTEPAAAPLAASAARAHQEEDEPPRPRTRR